MERIKNLFNYFKKVFYKMALNGLNYLADKLTLFLQKVNSTLQPVYTYLESEECIKKQDEFINKVFNIWIPKLFFRNYALGLFLIIIILNIIFGWWVAFYIAAKIIFVLQFIYHNNGLNFFEVTLSLILCVFFIFPRIIPSYDVRVGSFLISIGLFFLILVKIAAFDVSKTFEICSEAVVGKDYAEHYSILFFAVDGLSLTFALLVTFIFPIVILTAWDRIFIKLNFFYFNLIILEVFVLGAFFAMDLFLFFVFFEAIFIPMTLIITIWGGRQRKIKATSYLLLYTLFGSIFFLCGILYLQSTLGTTNYFLVLERISLLSVAEVRVLWIFFFIPFAIKIPMFPFHIWSPEAHVEAPTAGSIVLAAVLLKLGGYGFIRFLLPLSREATIFFSPIVCFLAALSMVYAALSAFRQTDIKKMIAYSSIVHMNFAVLGIFSLELNALYGAVVLMLGHGIVSAALFFLAGVLYDRYHTRTILYYGGLAQVMPLFSSFFFFFTIANLGFPCSPSFIGEFILFLGIYKKLGFWTCFIVGFCSVLSTYMNIQLFTSICFGTSNTNFGTIYQDLTLKELKILLLLTTVCILCFVFHSSYINFLTQGNFLYFHLYF